MKNVYSSALHWCVSIVIFLSCTYSMKSQEVRLYSTGTGEEYPMSEHYPEYTYLGFLSEGQVAFIFYPLGQPWGYTYNVYAFPNGNSLSGGNASNVPVGYYLVTFNVQTYDYSFETPEDCFALSSAPQANVVGSFDGCESGVVRCDINPTSVGWNYQWFRNGVSVSGANSEYFTAMPSSTEDAAYSCIATCAPNNNSVVASELTLPQCYNDTTSSINYLLVQNVTTTGNVPGQSIQVQFDLNWGNTWKDDVNWDAVWVFMKYKDAQGLWKHAKISPTGYDHGQGTPNLIEPTADQMGAFVRLALEGQGNFNSEGMQLRWNYGADGLSSVSGIEVRVFAVEMVYHPQGGFSVRRNNPNENPYDYGFFTSTSTFLYDLKAPGDKIVVVNNHLSPKVSMEGDTLRIKGDAGMDYNADGVVDNTNYPTGYYPFYLFKYELSEQQYADFLNCLTPVQRGTLGVAGSTITEVDGDYYAANPNRVCIGASPERLLAYADWSGLRPMSFLELQKAFNGPKNPDAFNWFGNQYTPSWDGYDCDYMMAGGDYGSGFYGAKSLWFFAYEPFMLTISNTFSRYVHGNGTLSSTGLSNTDSWLNDELHWGRYFNGWCDYYNFNTGKYGFRLTRSAE
jgi:hypothetical protein